MIEFCIDFHDGPEGNRSVRRDIMAENSDDAFRKAYRMPEAKHYSNVTIYKKPQGKTCIGIEFIYTDTVFKQDFHGYVFVDANSEREASDWYCRNLRGKRFWFNAHEPKPDGKNVYGRVIKTYFADGFAKFDAEKELSV